MSPAFVLVVALAADPFDALIDLDHAVGGEPIETSDGPLSSRLALAQVSHLWEQADYLSAVALLQNATPEPLLDPVVQFVLAQSFAYSGNLAAAERGFEALLTSEDPAIAALANRRLAEVELDLGKNTEAATRLRALLQHNAGSAVLEIDLARALAGTPEGSAALERAYLLDPEGELGAAAQRLLEDGKELGHDVGHGVQGLNPREVLSYARKLVRSGHPEEALAALGTVAAADRSGEMEVCAAQCERALGHGDVARDHLTRAAKLSDPKAAATARIALARAEEAAGDVSGAIALLLQVAKSRARKPEGSEAAYLAAWMAMDHGDTHQAFKLFGSIAARRKDKHATEARWWTGWEDELLGRPGAAVAAWKPLVSPLTSGVLGPQVLYWSARAKEENGDSAGAEVLRRQLLKVAPTSFYALLERGGAPGDATSELLPQCQVWTAAAGGTLAKSLRRGELLWALGLEGLARSEMDAADQQAKGAPEALAVADVESALGEPGRAFNLVQARGGGCFVGSLLAPQFFPRPYRAEVERAAAAADIDPIWLWSIMRQESRFERRAKSQAAAGGAMQLLEPTIRKIATIAGVASDRDDPTQAIEAAAWYLKSLSDRFGGDLSLVAAAYNAGPVAVASWLANATSNGTNTVHATGKNRRRFDVFVEQIPFRETRGYVKAVAANAASYRALFGPAGALVDPSSPPRPAAPDGVAF